MQQGFGPGWHKNRSLRAIRLLARAIVSCLFWTAAHAATLELDASEETIFRQQTDRCDPSDNPDAPARAFRLPTGEMRMFASDTKNRSFLFVGDSLVNRTCDIAFGSRRSSNPAEYSDSSFLTAFWTFDGINVAALVHDEYHPERYGKCEAKNDYICWYNTITFARSFDSGATFLRPKGSFVVVSPSFKPKYNQSSRVGFFNPSNIFEHNGFFYSYIHNGGYDGQSKGVCLFRTHDVFNPQSWRGWNGKEFAARFFNPFDTALPPSEPCHPLVTLRHPISSVTRIEGTNKFLAVALRGTDDRAGIQGAVVYSVTDNLLAWPKWKTLTEIRSFDRKSCDSHQYAYPSLIDHDSLSRNFDSVGRWGWLYLTRFNLSDCRHTMDRDLVRRRVRIDSSL